MHFYVIQERTQAGKQADSSRPQNSNRNEEQPAKHSFSDKDDWRGYYLRMHSPKLVTPSSFSVLGRFSTLRSSLMLANPLLVIHFAYF